MCNVGHQYGAERRLRFGNLDAVISIFIYALGVLFIYQRGLGS